MDASTKASLYMAIYIFVLYFITSAGTIITVGSSTVMSNGIHAAVFTAIFYYTFGPVSLYIAQNLV